MSPSLFVLKHHDTYLDDGVSSGMRTSTTGTVAGTEAWGLKVPE